MKFVSFDCEADLDQSHADKRKSTKAHLCQIVNGVRPCFQLRRLLSLKRIIKKFNRKN